MYIFALCREFLLALRCHLLFTHCLRKTKSICSIMHISDGDGEMGVWRRIRHKEQDTWNISLIVWRNVQMCVCVCVKVRRKTKRKTKIQMKKKRRKIKKKKTKMNMVYVTTYETGYNCNPSEHWSWQKKCWHKSRISDVIYTPNFEYVCTI